MTDSRPPRVKPKNTEIAALAAMLVVRMRTTQHGTAESVASPYHFDAYEWLTLLDRCLDKALAFQHVEAVDDLVRAGGQWNSQRGRRTNRAGSGVIAAGPSRRRGNRLPLTRHEARGTINVA